MINAVNELVYGGIESLENALGKIPPEMLGFHPKPGMIRDTDDDGRPQLEPAEAGEIEKGLHQLETLWETAVDRSFDKFEIFVMRNLLVVEEDLVPWVRLEHHKVSIPIKPLTICTC